MTSPTGARSATGRQHSGLRWLPWLLLLILAVVVAVVVVIVVNVNDDDGAADSDPNIGLAAERAPAAA